MKTLAKLHARKAPKVMPKATPMLVRLADLADLKVVLVGDQRYALIGSERRPIRIVFGQQDTYQTRRSLRELPLN